MNLQFIVPTMACTVVDRAMQAFGAEGLSQDQELAQVFAGLRTLRFADVSHLFVIITQHHTNHAPTIPGTGRGSHPADWAKRAEARSCPDKAACRTAGEGKETVYAVRSESASVNICRVLTKCIELLSTMPCLTHVLSYP